MSAYNAKKEYNYTPIIISHSSLKCFLHNLIIIPEKYQQTNRFQNKNNCFKRLENVNHLTV